MPIDAGAMSADRTVAFEGAALDEDFSGVNKNCPSGPEAATAAAGSPITALGDETLDVSVPERQPAGAADGEQPEVGGAHPLQEGAVRLNHDGGGDERRGGRSERVDGVVHDFAHVEHRSRRQHDDVITVALDALCGNPDGFLGEPEVAIAMARLSSRLAEKIASCKEHPGMVASIF